METRNIINFLNDSGNKESKFATRKWYVIDSQKISENKTTLSNLRQKIKSSPCDYSDAFI